MLHVEQRWPVPVLGDDDVLIAVGACALNATDINTRVGWYAADDDNGAWDAPISFPRIQGADVCGHVVAAGQEVRSAVLGRRVVVDPWVRDPQRPGDLTRCRYLGSELDGGFAEYVAVPARNAHPVESAMTDVELASFATSSGTALNMVRRAGVRPGQDVLVTGASGGVGAALIQLVGLAGARPIGLCHPDKAEAVRANGAVVTIDRTVDLAEALRAEIGRSQVDCILDVVGGPRWPELIDVPRPGRHLRGGRCHRWARGTARPPDAVPARPDVRRCHRHATRPVRRPGSVTSSAARSAPWSRASTPSTTSTTHSASSPTDGASASSSCTAGGEAGAAARSLGARRPPGGRFRLVVGLGRGALGPLEQLPHLVAELVDGRRQGVVQRSRPRAWSAP